MFQTSHLEFNIFLKREDYFFIYHKIPILFEYALIFLQDLILKHHENKINLIICVTEAKINIWKSMPTSWQYFENCWFDFSSSRLFKAAKSIMFLIFFPWALNRINIQEIIYKAFYEF